MKVSEEALAEFEALWQEDHPDLLTDRGQLSELAACVLRAVAVVYQPIDAKKAQAFWRVNGTQHPQTNTTA